MFLCTTCLVPESPMIDFPAARRIMVDSQVRTSDVTDLRLIAAMLQVPRERFLPQEHAALAYLDRDVRVGGTGEGGPRWLIKPMVLAKLIQAAEVREGDLVLDVGCATGYSSAVLARLAGLVIALEEDATLAQRAAETLLTVGASNVTVVTGPLSAGWPAAAPYDVIFLNGATEVPPRPLLEQLKPGGRLVGVLGRAPSGQAMLYRASEAEPSGRPIFDAVAPVLPGMAKPETFVF
jgi:protein-L-isoaspartate(D-aspartate) O-methyltransferase